MGRATCLRSGAACSTIEHRPSLETAAAGTARDHQHVACKSSGRGDEPRARSNGKRDRKKGEEGDQTSARRYGGTQHAGKLETRYDTSSTGNHAAREWYC